jgi:hypothetical protein
MELLVSHGAISSTACPIMGCISIGGCTATGGGAGSSPPLNQQPKKLLRPDSYTHKSKGWIKKFQSTPSPENNYPDLCGVITANEKMPAAVVGTVCCGSREVEAVHSASADSLPHHGLHPHWRWRSHRWHGLRRRLVHLPDWISSQEKLLRSDSCTHKGKGWIKNLQSDSCTHKGKGWIKNLQFTPSPQTNLL